MATVPAPTFTDGVDLRYFLEPLGGPGHPKTFLDRFPDALYNKAPDSHFMRFMSALLGPTGIGWLKKDILLARLQLEHSGVNLADLEAFYGDPFSFGRILDEYYNDDISGLLPFSVWSTIQAQDEAYRARAIKFLNAVRLGTSPAGMQLAASSGLGSNVAIAETYKYLFDIHSDLPLGLPYYGHTNYLGEFAVIPRPEASQAQTQTVRFDLVTTNATSYTFSYNGYSATVATGADSNAVQLALSSLTTPAGTSVITPADVIVMGGPIPTPVTVIFTGELGNSGTFPLQVSFLDSVSGLTVIVPVEIVTGLELPIRTATFAPSDIHAMQVALDYLRPVASFPTFTEGQSLFQPQVWLSAAASTEYEKVLRYVTGTATIAWSATDATHWIQAGLEVEAPRLSDDVSQHYVNFHNVVTIDSYTDTALTDPLYGASTATLTRYPSMHVGPFPEESRVIQFFTQFANSSILFDATRALANTPEHLTVTDTASDGTALINGIYPGDSLNLPGAPVLTVANSHFWSSVDRTSGAEILEIDLGSAQAVNYIRFEVLRKPVDIQIAYDVLDQAPARRFIPVTVTLGALNNHRIFYEPTEPPWETVEWSFNDSEDMILTRVIRITLTRRNDSTVYGRYMFDPVRQVQLPWTINVRNLRIGRNIAPSAL